MAVLSTQGGEIKGYYVGVCDSNVVLCSKNNQQKTDILHRHTDFFERHNQNKKDRKQTNLTDKEAGE